MNGEQTMSFRSSSEIKSAEPAKLHAAVHRFMVAAVAALILPVSLLSSAAFADGVSSSASALHVMWQQDYQKIRACQMIQSEEDGSLLHEMLGKVDSMKTAIHCWSVNGQLTECYGIALQAGTVLEIERSGRFTFAELESKAGHDKNFAEGLSLAEVAPKSMSPYTLTMTTYKRCASYASLK
jgi:hypothetical protein